MRETFEKVSHFQTFTVKRCGLRPVNTRTTICLVDGHCTRVWHRRPNIEVKNPSPRPGRGEGEGAFGSGILRGTRRMTERMGAATNGAVRKGEKRWHRQYQ